MTKYHRWLQGEIDAWLHDDLIDDRQAQALRGRYPVDTQSIPWSRLIVSAIGAVVFGLGVILLFAYNWADMHKYVKLAVVFGALVLAHGAAIRVSASAMARPVLGESLHVMGTMFFGAGIWLIAQIYHIDEHYPNAFFVWGLGGLALAWAMPSIAQGLLAVVLMFLWGCFEVFDFSYPNHPGAWVVLLGIVPLAWVRHSRVLLFFSLATFMALFVFSVFRVDDELLSSALFFTACAYLAAATLTPGSGFPQSSAIFRSIGYVVYLTLLYIFSFRGVGKSLTDVNPQSWLEWLYFGVPMMTALVAWGVSLTFGSWQRADATERWETGAILMAMALMLFAHFGVARSGAAVVALPFNVLFLAHSVILIVQGTQRVDWKRTSLGCVLVAALVVARFADLFDSLLMRSLVFLALGAGLFMVGNFYSRRKKRGELAHA